MGKIILGVDPGTRVTGYGIINNQKQNHDLLDFGTIKTKLEDPPEKKFLTIYQGLKEVVNKYNPDCISIETQFVFRNVQSAFKVGMTRGVVMLLAAQNEIPIFEYAPKKAKLAVTGSGSASKEQVLRMIKMLLGIKEIKSEDAADALALAICHAHYGRQVYV